MGTHLQADVMYSSRVNQELAIKKSVRYARELPVLLSALRVWLGESTRNEFSTMPVV